MRDHVLLSLSMLASISGTAAISNRSGIGCAILETDHIGRTPHSDTKLNNTCTTIISFTHVMVDRLNFFVMNISCCWIPVYHRDWRKSTLEGVNFLIFRRKIPLVDLHRTCKSIARDLEVSSLYSREDLPVDRWFWLSHSATCCSIQRPQEEHLAGRIW